MSNLEDTVVPGYQELEEALATFSTQHRRLTNALNVGHAMAREASAEVIALGLDVRDSCVLLTDLYGGALAEFLAEHKELTSNYPPPPPLKAAEWTEHEWQAWLAKLPVRQPDWAALERLYERQASGRSWSSRLSVSYKTSFFFIRAYQDALCRVLLVAAGQRAGGYSSMNAAMKRPTNPVRLLLDRQLPEYGPWFRQWAGLRDKLKRGTALSFRQIGTELGVVFSGIAAPEGKQAGLTTEVAIFLGDVASALDKSAAAAAVTVDRLTANFDADSRAYVDRLD